VTSSPYSPQLSKSRFTAGLQCLKRLYLECYKRDLADPIDERQQAIFDTGNGVGELAREMYPYGRLVEEQYFEHAKAIRTTEKIITDATIQAIFEGAFAFEKIRIRADILKRNDDGTFDLIEVKSTTSAKSQHIPDIAIQLYVLEGLGVPIREAYLMHINKEYVYQGGPYDLEGLFALKDVTEASREFVSKTSSEKLSQMWDTLQAESPPTVDTGPHCTRPYRCPFYSHCHQQVTDHPISDLPRASREFLNGLKESGIEDIRLIPADYPGLNALQQQVRECVVNDCAFVGPELLSKLSKIDFPVSFLDFETFSPALPAYVGTSPYQAVPFQWSLHIKDLSGHLSHRSFLWSDQDDPRTAFVESLINAIPTEGTIVAYSSYEQRIMKDLATEFPAFENALFDLCERTFDLLKLVREEYYHPQFHGSFSIKSVLPALVPEMGYGDLEIQHGLVAALDFVRMVAEGTPVDEKEKTREALLAYCEKDTEAMVRVFDVLCSMGK
jgi:hypothetical protein